MSNINITVERPLLFLILIPALILGIIPFLRIQKRRRASVKHLVPFIIHLTLIFVLSGLLGGVVATEVTDEELETKVVFVADVSDSNIAMKDDMNSFIKSVIKEADKDKTKFALVMFANNVVKIVDQDEFSTSASDFLKFDSKAQKTDQSNMEMAIKLASDLFTEQKQNKKIIVLSDGMETVGDGIAAASQLDKGIQLSGKHFSMVNDEEVKEVQLVSINTNGKVAEGGDVTVEVVLKATRFVRTVTIKIEDGDITKTLQTKLDAGTSVFKLTYTPEVAGVNTIKATVEVGERDDSLSGNNTLYAWYSLDAQKTILIVDGDADSSSQPSQFAQIKASQVVANLSDYAVRGPVSPKNFPKTLEEMLEYDQIVLMDVNFSDLPATAGANLKRYVEEVGRGLFVSFGDNFYKLGENGYEYKDSPIAEILPVELKLEEERETVAMVLVVDLSSSMKELMGSKSRFELVVESVKKVLMLGSTEEEKEKNEGFNDNDYVGIVCFDQDSHIALEMQPLGDKANREEICEIVEYELRHYYYAYYLDKDGKVTDIPVHRDDGDKYTKQGYTYPLNYNKGGEDKQTGQYIKSYGTSYKWAIQSASDMISRANNKTPLHIKQVLMMSDGAPNDKGSGYEAIVERMSKSGTVTSAISIGASDGSEQLEQLSKIAEAGKGTIVQVNSAQDLTNEIVEKAEEVTPDLVNEKDVLPQQLSLNSSVLKGVRDYEIIGGYYSSVIKPEADLVLYVTHYLKPLYAEWEFGLGKVSVFMSDLGNVEWTSGMFDDSNGITLISNMLEATMNRQVDSSGLDYSVSRDEETATVIVNTPVDVRDGEHLIAQVKNSEGKVQSTVTFGKTAIKKYKATVPTPKTDETYIIELLLVDDKTDTVNDTRTFAVTGYYNQEYDVFAEGGEMYITGLANNANGKLLDTANGLFDDADSEIQIFEYNINTPLVIAALILFILDILFRNIVVIRKKEKKEMTDEEQIASMRGR